MKQGIYKLITIAAISIIILINCIFIIDEREQGIVLQFGEAQRVIREPGLHFKLPLIQTVSYYDKRILGVIADEKEVISKDQKRLIVSAYAKYKISDPLKFYRTVTNTVIAKRRLDTLLDSSMRQVLGEVPLGSLLTSERTEIMQKIKSTLNKDTAGLGIDLVDVRIIRADLPKENSNAIFKRMQTNREQEAKLFRAEGEEESTRIKAEAEMEKDKIIAQARQKAEILKGQADAEVTNIYATAYNRDKEFFQFYRTMDIYNNSLSNNDTTIVISPQNEFLKYLTDFNKK